MKPLALLSLLSILALPAPGGAQCEAPSPLTVMAMDTTSGRTLFTLAGGDTGWWVELGPDERTARRFPGFEPGQQFAGSIGPGPILALSRCGEDCVQAVRWKEGVWETVGSRVAVSPTSNQHLTYDRAGRPWLLIHALAGERGLTDVSAFRLVGDRWQPRGRLIVHAAGTPAAYPAPWSDTAILSGTGQFSAGSDAEYWLQGFPPTPEPEQGNLVALTETAVALLSNEGKLFHSRDRGAGWVAQRWRPWGEELRPLWTHGTDYAIDLPLGTFSAALPTIWFDTRPLREPELHLAELGPQGEWRRLADSVPEVQSPSGEPLEVVTFLQTAGGRWLLLSDCYTLSEQAGFTLRTYPPLGLSRPTFVPIVASAP